MIIVPPNHPVEGFELRWWTAEASCGTYVATPWGAFWRGGVAACPFDPNGRCGDSWEVFRGKEFVRHYKGWRDGWICLTWGSARFFDTEADAAREVRLLVEARERASP